MDAMHQSPDDIRYEMRTTRAELSDTITELKSELRDRTTATATAARRAVNVADHTRDNPWVALVAALATGFALGVSGTDRKALSATAAGGVGAGQALASAATGLRDTVARRGGDSDAEMAVSVPEPRLGSEGVRGRIAGQVQALLADGLDDLLRTIHPPPRKGVATGVQDQTA